MANNHLDKLALTFTLAPSPISAAGFGAVLLLVDEAAGNALGGARFKIYANSTEVDADVTGGLITLAAGTAANDMFSQIPSPAQVLIGRVNTAGTETYDVALAACEVAGAQFYGVAIDSRAAADILAVSAAAETRNILFAAQSSDVGWLTTGLPAAFAALAGRERTVVCYHDIDTENFDAVYLANRLVFDPDVTSAPWIAGLKEVLAYLVAPTSGEKAFLSANNANYGLPLGTESFFVYDGVNCNGRAVYQIETIDWLKARIEEDLAALITSHSARGEKILVDESGQAKILAILEGRFSQGVDAGHFLRGNVEAIALTITDADRAAAKLRFAVRGTFAVGATSFDIAFNFSTSVL